MSNEKKSKATKKLKFQSDGEKVVMEVITPPKGSKYVSICSEDKDGRMHHTFFDKRHVKKAIEILSQIA
jgi:hypothetical protein